MNDSELTEAKETAYRFLSFRARTVFEVRKKLSEKGYAEETTEEVLQYLKRLKYVDDEAFAVRMAGDLVKVKRCGPYYVADKLRKKGIPGDLAARVIEELFTAVDERETAKKLILSKQRESIRSPNEKRRLGRYLQSRGYGWETIQAVMQEFNDRERD